MKQTVLGFNPSADSDWDTFRGSSIEIIRNTVGRFVNDALESFTNNDAHRSVTFPSPVENWPTVAESVWFDLENRHTGLPLYEG